MMDQPEDARAPDHRVTALVDQIAALPLTIISGATFVDQTVHLDGRSFIRCTFRDCILVTGLGHFEMVGRQTFAGHTVVQLGQPAQYAHELFTRIAEGNTRRPSERHHVN